MREQADVFVGKFADESIPMRLPITMNASRFVIYLSLGILFVGLNFLRWYLLGYGPTQKGGNLGCFIDNLVRLSVYNNASQQHKDRFKRIMGHDLPELAETTANQRGVQVLLNSYLMEHSTRTKARRAAVEEHLQASKSNIDCTLRIIQPDSGKWYRWIGWKLWSEDDNIPLDHKSNQQALVFSEEEIDTFLVVNYETIYNGGFQELSRDEQIQIFGIAAVYHYGGIFVSPEIRTSNDMKIAAPDVSFWVENNHKCDEERFLYKFANNTRIHFLASNRQNPHLKCVLEELASVDNKFDFTDIIHYLQTTSWDPTCSPRCCLLYRKTRNSRKLNLPSLSEELNDHRGKNKPRFSVTISEKDPIKLNAVLEKERISKILDSKGCSAGWFCNRCLRTPLKGSLQSCKSFCRSCYQQTICNGVSIPKKDVVVDVSVQENNGSYQEKRIPRIIHQTWFEPLDAKVYPHLHRLQQSWATSGWDYRFYTDEKCREYVKENYPKRFLEAYDAILPGAFKADLFRLLVLFKDGGVYADIDVHLDANLDYFIPPDLSFFIPRDVPLDYWPGSNYCLWNGLLGSSPGHPIIAKAIEDVVNTISNRIDYLDIERSLCKMNFNSSIWKLRSLPILILTGPCQLGMSVNSVIGNQDHLQGFRLGWLNTAKISRQHDPPDHYWGDALLLLADRYDLGELRFTDINRNMLIASSNQNKIARMPIPSLDKAEIKKKTSIHYSKSESDIVGEYGIYRDKIPSNEMIQIRIAHSYFS